ncbi:MAG: hypothetical protein OXT71_06160 [Acidobacteriota bacterium]|nr:hypothetical protein [Acidobacteriota bacterium]
MSDPKEFRFGGFLISLLAFLVTVGVAIYGLVKAFNAFCKWNKQDRIPEKYKNSQSALKGDDFSNPSKRLTGGRCGATGLWRSSCQHREQKLIRSGETFPLCWHCRRGVYWKLIRPGK